MDAGTVQGIRDRDARPDGRRRDPRPRRPGVTPPPAADETADAPAQRPAADPAAGPRRLDVIA